MLGGLAVKAVWGRRPSFSERLSVLAGEESSSGGQGHRLRLRRRVLTRAMEGLPWDVEEDGGTCGQGGSRRGDPSWQGVLGSLKPQSGLQQSVEDGGG
ncbi:unnamed protein product [Lota lota]